MNGLDNGTNDAVENTTMSDRVDHKIGMTVAVVDGRYRRDTLTGRLGQVTSP